MNCIKCKGTNFVKSGTSFIVPTTTYLLCECGNVMMKDSRFGDKIIPTPESGELAEIMMKDAAIALGLPEANFVKTEEEIKERENALINLLNNLINDEDEYDVCDECEEDDEDNEFVSDETIDEFIDFVDKITAAINNPILTAMWQEIKESENIYNFIKETEKNTGISLEEIMHEKQRLIDAMPDALAQDKNKEEILAKLTALGLRATDSKFTPTNEKSIDTLLEEIFDEAEEFLNNDEDEENDESYLDKPDKEELKSYVILIKDAGWKLYRNKTKEQMSAIINENDEIDDFAIFEVKPVEVIEKLSFSIQ